LKKIKKILRTTLQNTLSPLGWVTEEKRISVQPCKCGSPHGLGDEKEKRGTKMEKQKTNSSITAEELKRMSEVDIRTVDRNELVDIETVEINKELPPIERVEDYIRQIKNPYCYLSHGVKVKISFAGKKKLEDCISDAMFA
jgi:hypothetical protein